MLNGRSAGSFGAYLFDLSVALVQQQAAAAGVGTAGAEARRAAKDSLPTADAHELALIEDARRANVGRVGVL